LRREHRISVQKSTQIDIAEIEQFTKEMRLKIQLYGVAASSPKKESGVVRDVTVKEGNERNAANEKNEGVGAGDRLKGSSSMRAKKYKRQSYASIKQQINQLHSISFTVKREKEGITRIGGNAEKKGQQHHLSDEDRLEAWWKERQRNALRRSGSTAQQSSGERFDKWWEAQREIRKPTTFSDPDPTLKDDNEDHDNKKKMTPPTSKAVDDTIKEVAAFVRQVKATENSPSLQNKSTEKQQQQQVAVNNDSPGPALPEVEMSNPHAEPSSSPEVAEDTSQDKPSPKHSPAAAAAAAAAVENSATSGALNLILSRIDEAKVQFAKALEESDVKKQADLAALLAKLGEAAVALKKLDQL
jgi:hypothetical protein